MFGTTHYVGERPWAFERSISQRMWKSCLICIYGASSRWSRHTLEQTWLKILVWNIQYKPDKLLKVGRENSLIVAFQRRISPIIRESCLLPLLHSIYLCYFDMEQIETPEQLELGCEENISKYKVDVLW
ncbi:uncharacterized protein LOC130769998 [Actinidia eriantha]|uniref:uncharacterized protein LOC130769998 n=1 Tax=Actinidia eriantha TaxID=165200 RepID=UPI0025901BCF|nr:uncharacterized protein LOC130769998 [Actinidia eriantha]